MTHRFGFCFGVGAHLRDTVLNSKALLRAGFQSGTSDCQLEDIQNRTPVHTKVDGQGTEQGTAGMNGMCLLSYVADLCLKDKDSPPLGDASFLRTQHCLRTA